MIEVKKISSENSVEFIQLINLFHADDNKICIKASSENYLKTFLSICDNHVLIAFQDKEVVGGLIAYELKMYKTETTEMFLFEIGVKSDCRKQGIATQLINELKGICMKKNIVQMFVLTASENHAANALYKKTGGIADKSTVMYSYFFTEN